MTTDTQKYQLIFRSEPKNILKIETLIDDLRNEHNISADVYGNMLVAMTEAVNNAIFHGNKCDKSKEVKIAYEKEKNRITFFVADQGSGFDYNNLPDPTSEENLEKPSGRGVFLMTQLADLVSFSDKGSTVELQFKI